MVHSFVMGVYGPMTSFAQSYIATAVLFDIDYAKNFDPSLQARYGPPIIQIPNIPNINLTMYLGTSNSNTDAAMSTVLDWFLGRPPFQKIDALVGGYHSAISMPVAALAAVFKMPQVSFGSTSPKLSNKGQYPFFARSIPPDSIQGLAMWKWVVQFQVPAVTIFFAQESYGEGLFSAVNALAAAAGQVYRVGGVGLPYMPINYDRARAEVMINQGKSLGSKFLLLIMTPDQATQFLYVLSSVNVICTPLNNWQCEPFQILGSEAIGIVPGIITDFEPAKDTPVGLMKFNPVSRGRLFPQFETMWKALRRDDVIGAAPTAKYKIDYFQTPLASATSAPITDAMFDNLNLFNLEDPFLFDAGYTYIHAVNNLMLTGKTLDQITGEEIKAEILNVNFEGISGAVAYDSNGDRLASYEFVNWEPVAASAPLGPRQASIIGLYAADTDVLSLTKDPYWMSATPSTPVESNLPLPILTACLPGTSPDVQTGMCIGCPSGRSSPGGADPCSPCQMGTHSANTSSLPTAYGAVACATCTAGRFAGTEGQTACDPCPLGTYNNSVGCIACSRCEIGKFADREAATECDSCPGTTTTRIEAATLPTDCACPPETIRMGDMTSVTSIVCAPCPVGMICDFGCQPPGTGGSVEPSLKPYYWSSVESPLSIYRCALDSQCVGGQPGSACGQDLEGMACAQCKDGFAWNGRSCAECPGAESSTFVYPALPFILCPAMILILYMLFGDDYSKWNRWQHAFWSIGFLLVNQYQITTMLVNSNIVLPNSSSSLLRGFSFTKDLMNIFPSQCAGFKSFSDSFAIKVMSPAIAGAICVLLWAIFWLVNKIASKVPALDHNRLINTYLALVFTFYGGIVDTSSSIFKCAPNPNGSKSLISDRSMVCYEGSWNDMLGIGLVGVICWILGFGALFIWAVMRAPRVFKDPNYQMRWKFLFIKFRDDVHWWAIVFIVKGVLLNLGYLFLETAVAQLIWVLLFNTIYLWGSALFRPWRHVLVNLLDPTMHSFLMMIVAAFMWFARTTVPEGVDLDADMNSIIIAATVMLLPFSAFCAISSAALQKAPALVDKKRKTMEESINIFSNVAPMDKTDLSAKVEEMADWDVFFITKAMQALGTEIMCYRARSGVSSRELSSPKPEHKKVVSRAPSDPQPSVTVIV
eukprot:CAMPEP_0197897074 /NCGR_PEP_ID=MMETSP1439-20131203/41586_1 /TAXON_ID=66791 /ORGANISM="Gonyaulax spinifera, Strain CCMP409" /LENGTH=1155 /DNA_ID=CAMNT_0043517679 /DNA_START=115 /DNA_END=3582 /DNA_ORIENTATION=+